MSSSINTIKLKTPMTTRNNKSNINTLKSTTENGTAMEILKITDSKESKNTIHQRSKSINSSKNLIEDLNELSGFLDINNINYSSKEISFIDDQFEMTEKKCASFDDSPILIDNGKKNKNFVYSNKKVKRKNYFNGKSNKERRSNLFCKLKNDNVKNNNEKCFIY